MWEVGVARRPLCRSIFLKIWLQNLDRWRYAAIDPNLDDSMEPQAQPERSDRSPSAVLKRYEKPVLRPLGHMTVVTQKTGPIPDTGTTFPKHP